MPTYTYVCMKCGHPFERFQSMSDEPVKRCPECKGKVRRTFNPVGIVLKGSGFHRNDYRSPSRKSGESAAKAESKSESKSSEGSSSSESKKSDSGSESKKSESKRSDSKSSSEKKSSSKTDG